MPIGFNITAFPLGHWPDSHWPIHHFPGVPTASIRSDVLLHSPSFIIGSLIISENIMTIPSLNTDWPLYVSYLPDGENVQDNAGAIYDYFSEEHHSMRSGFCGRHFFCQVIIRSLEFEAGRQKIAEILNQLETINRDTIKIGDYEYEIQVVNPVSGIIPLGLEPETKRRYLFILNFSSVIKYLEAA